MRVIPPIIVTGAMVTASSIAEPSGTEQIHSLVAEYLIGAEVIETTYHNKYASLQGKTSTVTISIATPGVVTWAGHGLLTGAPVVLTTTGALPTGYTAGTTYYAVVLGVDTFALSATAGGASINTTGSQSGVHTAKSSVNINRALPVPPATKNDWWKLVGKSNKHAAFDLVRTSKTVGTSPMTMSLTPGQRADACAILGMVNVATLRVRQTSPSYITVANPTGTTYDVTTDLIIRRVADGYTYSYEPFQTSPSWNAFDLPPITDATVDITATSIDGAEVEVGSFLVGMAAYLGEAQWGAEADGIQFTRITRNEFGEGTVVPVAGKPTANLTLEVSPNRVSKINDLKYNLDGRAAFWSAQDDGSSPWYEPFAILGIWKRFTIRAKDYATAVITLNLEEL